MLTIRTGDETFEIGMAGAELSGATGTPEERLAEAQRIMQLMNFEKMMNDTMDGQKMQQELMQFMQERRQKKTQESRELSEEADELIESAPE
jgi:hypothetical protein